jgi:S1-C subfamily serine protease
MKKVIGIIVLISFACVSSGWFLGPSDSETEIYKNAMPNVFRMLRPSNSQSGGTGFVINTPSGHRYLMSNRHVCDVAENGKLIAEQEGENTPTRVISTTEKTDLCLLEAPKGKPGLTLAEETKIYDRVFIIGHPYLNPITITSGHFNSKDWITVSYCYRGQARAVVSPFDLMDEVFNTNCVKSVYAYFTSAHAAPGNSGSPVVNTEGQVVGVLFAGSPTDLSFVVPLSDIKKFLEE